jgi:hypothetical protein
MWPFDREKRERIANALADIQQRVKDAMARNDEQTLRDLRPELARLAHDAPSSVTSTLDTWALFRQMREYLDKRTEDRQTSQAAGVEEQLRPCTMCKGREFHLSRPLWIEELGSKGLSSDPSPTMRLAVCASCGHTTVWMLDLDEVHRSTRFSGPTIQAKAGVSGPFRE